MTLAAEDFAERRRLRRSRRFWRVLAIIALALAVLAVIWRVGEEAADTAAPHIARVDIEGVIGTDEPLLALLDEIAERETVSAVVLHIDSPGGTAVGGEATYAALRELAGTKPLVAQVSTLAASAGYMVAAAADHIVARNTSIVGSIGVIVQVPNVDELLKRVGVDVLAIKSAPLKAEPSPFDPIEPAEVEMMQRMVDDSYEWFVALVAERRPFDAATARRLADGSVYSGRQALENGLVDSLGGEDAVKVALAARDVDPELPVIRYEPRRDGGGIAGLLVSTVPGFDTLRERLMRALPLDGMVALWQGPTG